MQFLLLLLHCLILHITFLFFIHFLEIFITQLLSSFAINICTRNLCNIYVLVILHFIPKQKLRSHTCANTHFFAECLYWLYHSTNIASIAVLNDVTLGRDLFVILSTTLYMQYPRELNLGYWEDSLNQNIDYLRANFESNEPVHHSAEKHGLLDATVSNPWLHYIHQNAQQLPWVIRNQRLSPFNDCESLCDAFFRVTSSLAYWNFR